MHYDESSIPNDLDALKAALIAEATRAAEVEAELAVARAKASVRVRCGSPGIFARGQSLETIGPVFHRTRMCRADGLVGGVIQ